MPINRPWVAYVGPFDFPWGQPGSRRVFGVARSIVGAGYDVVVGSGESQPSDCTSLLHDDNGASLSYVGLCEVHPKPLTPARTALRNLLGWGKRTVTWLEQQSTLPSHVVVYGGSGAYVIRLSKWCRENGVSLILDVVEWYDPTHVKGGRFGPFSLSSCLEHRLLHGKADGIIAISSFLADYYAKKGLRVLRVPPTIELTTNPVSRPEETMGRLTKIVYCGTPGRKDALVQIVEAVKQLDRRGMALQLLVAGPGIDELDHYLPGTSTDRNVKALGRLPQKEIASVVASADFSIILRKKARFSMAGFPTKFVESLSAGTPVLTNATSDLGDYLSDNVNGFLIEECTIQATADALERACLSDEAKRLEMREAALTTARQFDWRQSIEPIKDLLDRTSK